MEAKTIIEAASQAHVTPRDGIRKVKLLQADREGLIFSAGTHQAFHSLTQFWLG